tara:strand:- start:217 stop:486 length:270 start_codon:yes stop_codon:yes gene_type:complete
MTNTSGRRTPANLGERLPSSQSSGWPGDSQQPSLPRQDTMPMIESDQEEDTQQEEGAAAAAQQDPRQARAQLFAARLNEAHATRPRTPV